MNKAAAISCHLAVALILTGFLAGLASATGTVAWESAVNLSQIPGRSFQTAVARDPTTGDLMVAWTDDGVADREEILGRRWNRTNRAWLPVENLSQSESWQRDGGPALAFGADGTGLLAWTRTYATSDGAPADGHDVLWRRWDGSTWSPEAVLLHGDATLPGSPGTFHLIPVPTTDAILLFIVWGTGYRTAEYRNGTWSELTPWDYHALDVTLAQVVVDPDGMLHAAAYGRNSMQWGSNAWFNDAYYTTYDGERWTKPLNLSSSDGVATGIGMAFDAQGRLHFLWSDPDSPFSIESLKSAIWERVYDGESWTANTEVTLYNKDQGIGGFSLATDRRGALHLAWSEGLITEGEHTALDIYYQTGDGSTWGIEERAYASEPDSRYPLLIAGAQDLSLFWQEIVWLEPQPGPLPEQEIYSSRRDNPAVPPHQAHLPLVAR